MPWSCSPFLIGHFRNIWPEQSDHLRDFAIEAANLAGSGALWREVILLAVGRLIFLQGDLEKPLALVNRLCPTRPAVDEASWRKAWLAGDALLTCGLQRVQKDEWGLELLERVQERLVRHKLLWRLWELHGDRKPHPGRLLDVHP